MKLEIKHIEELNWERDYCFTKLVKNAGFTKDTLYLSWNDFEDNNKIVIYNRGKELKYQIVFQGYINTKLELIIILQMLKNE